MANAIRIDSTKNIVNTTTSATSLTESFSTQVTFTLSASGIIQIAHSTSTYSALNQGSITTVTFARITSDQALNIKLNGGTTVMAGVKYFVSTQNITAITINNNSGTTANITYDLFG